MSFLVAFKSKRRRNSNLKSSSRSNSESVKRKESFRQGFSLISKRETVFVVGSVNGRPVRADSIGTSALERGLFPSLPISLLFALAAGAGLGGGAGTASGALPGA